jgi:hypothetical protein
MYVLMVEVVVVLMLFLRHIEMELMVDQVEVVAVDPMVLEVLEIREPVILTTLLLWVMMAEQEDQIMDLVVVVVSRQLAQMRDLAITQEQVVKV